MKEFEGKATWRVSEWGEEYPDAVVIHSPGSRLGSTVSHENQPLPAKAPDDLKAYVRREVLAHRPLAENELELRGKVRKMRIALPDEDYSAETVSAPEPGAPAVVIDHGGEGSAPYTRAELEALAKGDDRPRGWPRALAFLDKHWPKLADNQVYSTILREVWDLGWNDGKAQFRCGYRAWIPWHFGCDSDHCRKADAWFRANCPADRFVTDGGEVREFRMRDDGEAETVRDGKCWYCTGSPGDGGDSGVMCALYRFRDAERAKWRFKFVEWPQMVVVSGPSGTWHYSGAWPVRDMPSAWVRNRAEAMWRERQAKPVKGVTFEGKPAEFRADNDLQRVRGWDGSIVGFSHGPNKYIEIVFDDGTEMRVTGDRFKMPEFGFNDHLRVTIEAVESEGM